MKQVIFVCLLSLSLCLGNANQTQEAQVPPAGSSANPAGTAAKSPVAPEHPQVAPVETQTTTATATPAKVPPSPQTTNTTVNANATENVTPNETLNKKNETKPAENATNTKADKEEKPKPADDKKVLPESHNETKPAVPSDKPSNATNADNKEGTKSDTTKPKAEVVSSTTPTPVEAKTRAFDGPSFIGGIILTLGLLAIGFMGFKYYKNQTERNYHTL